MISLIIFLLLEVITKIVKFFPFYRPSVQLFLHPLEGFQSYLSHASRAFFIPDILCHKFLKKTSSYREYPHCSKLTFVSRMNRWLYLNTANIRYNRVVLLASTLNLRYSGCTYICIYLLNNCRTLFTSTFNLCIFACLFKLLPVAYVGNLYKLLFSNIKIIFLHLYYTNTARGEYVV